MLTDFFHITLVEPQIPQNTGSIARTCAALKCPLHIVGKTGFEINEKNVRRAGLDYWPYVQLLEHSTFEDFQITAQPKKIWCLSKFGEVPYHQVNFSVGDALVFGSETKGLGAEFLSKFPKEQILKIPMLCPEVRSLNLSNAVSIVAYEAMRKIKAI
jgi:tRNA (cytidine/uridine-2'-O-)-methyltransferase